MKIYTRTGDNGTTALFAGGRVPKDHWRVEAYGTVDELNSLLGLTRSLRPSAQTDAWLHEVQRQLFVLGADLATPPDAKSSTIMRIDEASVAWLETTIDAMEESLPPLTNFILPGGSQAGASLHVARTVCRRAERLLVALTEHDALVSPAQPYLNRLSDFLFVLARWENQQAGASEEKWEP
jgi:cob(I)alamin adenosyltransferase